MTRGPLIPDETNPRRVKQLIQGHRVHALESKGWNPGVWLSSRALDCGSQGQRRGSAAPCQSMNGRRRRTHRLPGATPQQWDKGPAGAGRDRRGPRRPFKGDGPGACRGRGGGGERACRGRGGRGVAEGARSGGRRRRRQCSALGSCSARLPARGAHRPCAPPVDHRPCRRGAASWR